MSELPGDWQDRMAAMIAGRIPLDGSLFTGGPTLGPLDQIAIYREQYRLRVHGAVRDDLLGLCALMGEEQVLGWAERFLAEHPPRSWTLNRAVHGFAAWFEGHAPHRLAWEMAQLDETVQRAVHAADGEPLELADLTGMLALALAPHVRLLRHRTPAYAVRRALLAGEDAPLADPLPEPVHLAIYRRGITVRHRVLEPGAWAVLRALGEGCGLLEALERAAASVPAAALERRVAGWFRTFAAEGLVVRRTA